MVKIENDDKKFFLHFFGFLVQLLRITFHQKNLIFFLFFMWLLNII